MRAHSSSGKIPVFEAEDSISIILCAANNIYMITKELLNKLFYYDDNSGELVGKITNKVASVKNGSGPDGLYRRVVINGRKYRLHVLIWIYHNGPISPSNVIDHIDGDRLNNRISNLRELSCTGNRINSKISSTNKSGITGIHRDNVQRCWKVEICYNGSHITVGRYPDLLEAACARLEAEYFYCHDKYIDMSPAKQYVINHIQPNHR